MNHTFNKPLTNPVSFDLFLNPKKECRHKKSALNPNTKIIYNKQAIFSGPNGHKPTNTIFNNYNNFPSLTKCHSTAKLTKTQNNSNASSKSLISFPQERPSSPSPSPQTNLSKRCNEKSFSTTQSTDERKELSRLRSELNEKNELIKSLHKTIDSFILEKNAITQEMISLKTQLADLKQENHRIQQDNNLLRDSYERIHCDNIKLKTKEIKLSEIINILNKEEISVIKANESNDDEEDDDDDDDQYYNEESLSGICFPDKVKAEKKVQANEGSIPALDFGNIHNDLNEDNSHLKDNDKAIKSKQFKKINKITGTLIKKKASIIKKLSKQAN